MKPTGKLAELAKIQRTGDRIVLPMVQEHLLSQWGHAGRDPCVVHVSEMAKKDWCERATYFRIVTGIWPEERYSFNMQSIFDEGHQIHDKWQQWLAETGKLWGDWECQVCGQRVSRAAGWQLAQHPCGRRLGHLWVYKEVELWHGLIHGHEDAAVGDRLVEFKSVGLGTLRKDSPGVLAKYYKTTTEGKKLYDLEALWTGLKQPLASHVRQANMYLWLARCMGHVTWSESMTGMEQYQRFTKASIVYEYKPNQQSREFVIPWSEDITAPLIERVGYIEVALAQEHPPLCPYGGCTQCHDYEASPKPARRLVHRPGGFADRGDRAAAGTVRDSGRRVRGG